MAASRLGRLAPKYWSGEKGEMVPVCDACYRDGIASGIFEDYATDERNG